jgi:hypothetical protein
VKRSGWYGVWIPVFLFLFSGEGFSAEFGQGGMSVIPSPLSPSPATTPMPTTPLPSPLPNRSSPSGAPPGNQPLPGITGLSAPKLFPTASRLVIRTTPPGARVFFDGIDLGRTPLNTEVPSGANRRLVLLLKGYRPVRRSIFVEAGKMLGMAFTLHPVERPSRPEKKDNRQKTP